MGKKKKRFKGLQNTALGLGGLGLTTGVSAAVAGRAAAGTPAAGITSGFGTIATGAGIATTIGVGGILLGQVKKLNKKKKGGR